MADRVSCGSVIHHELPLNDLSANFFMSLYLKKRGITGVRLNSE